MSKLNLIIKLINDKIKEKQALINGYYSKKELIMQDIDLLELEISEEIKNSSGNLRNYLYNYIKN